jgi:Tol biopolymer transport system component
VISEDGHIIDDFVNSKEEDYKVKNRLSVKAVISIAMMLLAFCGAQGFSQANGINARIEPPFSIQRANIPIEKGERLVTILSSNEFIKERHEGGEYSIIEVDSTGEKPITSGLAPMGDFSYSSASHRLCFSEGKEIVILNWRTGRSIRIAAIGGSKPKYFANISPSGKYIAYDDGGAATEDKLSLNEYSSLVKDIASGSERVVANGAWPKWSPDGNLIALTRSEGVKAHWTFYIWVVKPDGNELRKLTSSKGMAGWPVSWSDDGKYLMELDAYGNLHIVSVAKDSATLIPTSRFGADTKTYYREYLGASWVPGSKYVFTQVALTSTVQDETVIGVESYLVSVDGTQIIKLDLPKGASNFAFLNDSTLVFRDTDGLWNKANIGGMER